MALTAEDFLYLRQLLREQSSIVLDDGKEYLAELRLQTLASKLGMGSSSELMKTIRLDPGHSLRSKIVEAMTTNETSFFRDTKFFDMIQKQILPSLIASRNPAQKIRIWSAASSSGQEAYSIAMMLQTYFPELVERRVQIIGTDLSEEMVDRAKRGQYSQLEVNRGVPVAYLIRYFHRSGLDWIIDDSIRDMVSFRTMNLSRPWPVMPSQDLVLMRNVLIYFDPPSCRTVLNQVAKVMALDGYLILGGSETPMFNSDHFERVVQDGSVAYRLKSSESKAATASPHRLAGVSDRQRSGG